MTATATRWNSIAAELREDARGLPVEGAMMLHAAVIIETAAATFEARAAAATAKVLAALALESPHDLP
jgi:hypothetical protein